MARDIVMVVAVVLVPVATEVSVVDKQVDKQVDEQVGRQVDKIATMSTHDCKPTTATVHVAIKTCFRRRRKKSDSKTIFILA